MKKLNVSEEDINKLADECGMLRDFIDTLSSSKELLVVTNAFVEALFDIKPFGFKKVKSVDLKKIKNIDYEKAVEIEVEEVEDKNEINKIETDEVEKDVILQDMIETQEVQYEEIEYDIDETADMFEEENYDEEYDENISAGWNEFDAIPDSVNFNQEKLSDNVADDTVKNKDEEQEDVESKGTVQKDFETEKYEVENKKNKEENDEVVKEEVEKEANEWQKQEKDEIDVGAVLDNAIKETENVNVTKKQKKRFSPLKDGIKLHSHEDFIKEVAEVDTEEDEEDFSDDFINELL